MSNSTNIIKKALLGAALLAGLVASAARADVTVFNVTDTMFGPAFQGKSYEFTIGTTGPVTATLSDNGFLAPFDFLALAITKTGGGTMGSVTSPPTALPASFGFFATLTGSYTAIVIGKPSAVLPAGTFGVTVAAVPEPEVWAMMVVGLTLVGFRVIRKSRLSKAQRIA
ncbi:MAG: hypothetical protein IT514_06010 [Burkholderiales bacterium]|nr:hypothetical protein [Burkholderiales bacterium]